MNKIGTVEIIKDTFLKSHPLPSTDESVLKISIEKGNKLDLYERRPNENGHYHLIVGRDGQMPAKVYIYDLHAGIDLEDEDKSNDDAYVPKPATESTPKVFDADDINWSEVSDPISKYFTVGEATKGEPARTPKKGSIEANNILKLAAQLDNLREAYGKPIKVTSWYRPPAINRAIGGASQSQHINGGAADICPMDGDIEAFQDWCDERWFGALGYGAARGFVHLDIRNGKGFMSGGQKGVRWTY